MTIKSILIENLNEIISDMNLIPSVDELEDPISWAARTSLPPI